MIRIAVVEDNKEDRELLKSHIEQFEKDSRGEYTCKINFFDDGLTFVSEYQPMYDIIFMDIKMPMMDGLNAARRIRKTDNAVAIIFVTNMGKYAIKGYEVNAVDFLVKPVSYFNFTDKIKKAIELNRVPPTESIVVKTNDEIVRLPVSEVCFIEKIGHNLVYHTKNEEYCCRGNLKEIEDTFLKYDFAKCNRGNLVNFAYITKISKEGVCIGKESLVLSRGMAKKFKEDFLKYVRGY